MPGVIGQTKMKKLYQTIEGTIHYKEAWVADGKTTLHWGKVGDHGESESVSIPIGESETEAVERVLSEAVAEGYRGIPLDKHYQLVVQKQIDGQFGDEISLKWRHDTEEFINEDLGWAGCGFCDGGDIGAGKMNVFCYVVDPQIACETILIDLDEPDERYAESVIAYRDHADEYHVLWPRNHPIEFDI